MRYLNFTLSLLLVCIFSSLSAQSLRDVQAEMNDLHSANDAAIKTMSPNRGLIEPRKLQPRQGDLEKIYYNMDMKQGLLRMTTGDVLSANIRYRVLDQLMEVEYGGNNYTMDLSMVKAFSIGANNFVLLADPLKKSPGRVIHEVHYVDDKTLVLEQHSAEEDYREKLNNVPSSDSQMFRRKRDVILAIDGKVTLIDSNKDAMEALRIRKKSRTNQFIKAKRLKLKKAVDLAQVVQYLAEKESK